MRVVHLMLTLALLISAPNVPALAALSQLVTVTPAEDTEAVLHNPDMGWVLYENYPLDQAPDGSSTLVPLPNEDYAQVDSVALMFSWFDIEKRQGEYDFSKADYAYDYWKQRGKKIQLRMSAESLVWWTNFVPPSGKGIPDYVLENLPQDKRQTRLMEGIAYTVVDTREPFYRARRETFLAAVAAHFSGERAATLVDLRGFGVWGEWHSGYQYASTEERHIALKEVIDAYVKAFPQNYLSLSYSYDPDSPKPFWDGPNDKYDPAFSHHYEEFLHYSAFDYALTKPNITWRRDGAGGAVHSNERRLAEEAFHMQKGPMMCEFLGGYSANKKAGQKWVEWILDDALSLHPNYINLLGYQSGDALAFIKEQPNLMDRGLRRMGYRLVPTKVTYSSTMISGEPLWLDMQWVNRGVGRAMRDYRLKLLLTDAAGNVAATCEAGALDTANWIKGESYSVKKEIVFHNVMPGNYRLRLAVIDPATPKIIALPLAGVNKDGSYPIGTIACAKARAK